MALVSEAYLEFRTVGVPCQQPPILLELATDSTD